LIDGVGYGGRVRRSRLKGQVGPEDEGIVAIELVLHIKIDALIGRFGDRR
jgi:hypothetical protein